jgi:hypothetical protein
VKADPNGDYLLERVGNFPYPINYRKKFKISQSGLLEISSMRYQNAFEGP